MTLTLNYGEFERALVLYELAYPVRVRVLQGGPQGMAGKYHGIGRYGPTTDERLDVPAHHITVSDGLSAHMANVALLHELMHAHQNERFLPKDFNIQNDDHYRQANAGLREAFRYEMKDIRKRTNASSKALTMAYADVSFEVEARTTDKLKDEFKLFTESGNKPTMIGVEDLVDDQGRFTYRVDLWEWGKWDSVTKQMGKKKFRGTYYVIARDAESAKTFAKKEWGSTSDSAEAYLRPILDKNRKAVA